MKSAGVLLAGALILAVVGCRSRDEARQTPSPMQSGSSPAPVSAGLPAADRDLYVTLVSRLDKIAALLPAGLKGQTRFGAELLAANGNAGAALLSPGWMQAATLNLDALQNLGARGVSVQIADPLLAPDFPRSAEYLAFYQRVAAEVRRRGLVLMVETGPVFTGTEYSSVTVGDIWSTKEKYFRERAAQVKTIAEQIRPDFLSLGNEPQTEQMLTGLRFSLDEYLGFLKGAVAAVEPGPTKLGAGTGTWEDPTWARRILSEVRLDFLDLHLYPLTNGVVDYVQRLVDLTREAKARGKQVIVGEAWLYKVTDAELAGGQAIAAKFARDYYDAWAPADAKFIDTIGRLAEREGVEYVSFFWSKYFFGYLPYSSDLAARPAQELIRLSNQAASEGMRLGRATAAGEAFQKLAGAGKR